MPKDHLQVNPEEVWEKIRTPEKQTDIIRGTIDLVVSLSLFLNLPLEKVGGLFANLDDKAAGEIAHLYSGVADGSVVKEVGESLSKKG